MITRLGMSAQAPGLTTAQFQAHWAGSHAGATLALPGLRAYVQLPAVLGEGGEPLLAEWGYEAVGQLDFDDADAMDASFASEAYATTVAEDEARFIDKTRFRYGVYARSVPAPGDAPVRLALGWAEGAPAVEHVGPHERLDALPGSPAPFARVDLLGCADVEAALALAVGHPGARRLVARPIAVLART